MKTRMINRLPPSAVTPGIGSIQVKRTGRVLRIYYLSILTSFCVFLFTGCAITPTPKGMLARSAMVQNHYPFSVSVKAEGTKESNAFGGPGIPGEPLAEAIRNSITKYGLFRSVITTGSGDYLLEADIVKVDAPAAGFNMTVSMGIRWKLTHVSTGKIVFQQTTFKAYTATVGDAFAGVKRVRLAEEGAARENIEDALDRISQLRLDGTE